MYADRTDAGERLGDALVDAGYEADVVLAIPRGGLPVARPVAERLDADLDVIVASKLGAPQNPELAIGAVAGDGSVWVNDRIVDEIGVDDRYLERQKAVEADAAREKVERYRSGESAPDLTDKKVVLVDDGIATGATAIACLRQITRANAAHVVLAVPVGPRGTIESLRDEADDVFCLDVPASFGAVGQFYSDFTQVSDDEALAILRDHRS